MLTFFVMFPAKANINLIYPAVQCDWHRIEEKVLIFQTFAQWISKMKVEKEICIYSWTDIHLLMAYSPLNWTTFLFGHFFIRHFRARQQHSPDVLILFLLFWNLSTAVILRQTMELQLIHSNGLVIAVWLKWTFPQLFQFMKKFEFQANFSNSFE